MTEPTQTNAPHSPQRRPPHSPPRLSVVLPTFNEVENLPLVLERLGAALSGIPHEVIVVDDDSQDGTWQLAQQLSSERPWLHVIRRINERGLGSAITAGFASGRGEYLAVMDADMQHDELALRGFVEALQAGADVVVGTRYSQGGAMSDWPVYRRVISRVATGLAQWVLPNTVSDPMSGFFALRRSFFEEIAPHLMQRGFKLLLSVLYLSRGRRVAEVGYTFRSRQYGQTKLTGTVILDYLIMLYELRFGRLLPLRFVKYCLVGGSGVFVNQVGLLAGKALLHLPDAQALPVGIELSILTNFLLNNYWTFRDVKLRGGAGLLRGLISFNVICLAGALINYSVALWVSTQFGASIYWANLLGIALATAWNYVININVTWQKSTR